MQIGQERKRARVEGPFSQSLGEVRLTRDIALRLTGSADHAEKLYGILIEFYELRAVLLGGCVDLAQILKWILHKNFMKRSVEEYLAQADIFSDYEEGFGDIQSIFGV